MGRINLDLEIAEIRMNAALVYSGQCLQIMEMFNRLATESLEKAITENTKGEKNG